MDGGEEGARMSETTKVLWVNPIGNPGYDDPMGQVMAGIKSPGTQVDVVSLSTPYLPEHLEYRAYSALIVGDMVKMARWAGEEGYHSMVIGCFYDPALEDAREVSGSTVVVAPCQAAVQIAANIANRFSVIIGQEKWAVQMRERVSAYGYTERLASMRSIDIGVPELQKDICFTTEKIMEAGRRAKEEDKAEALILGCTCSFGMHEEVQRELGIPVIDPIIAAFKMAEFLGGLQRTLDLKPSRLWSCAPPPEAELSNFGIFAQGAPIGNKVTY
jgi:allantoin racemase